jgi:hypothetical protein
MAQANGDVKLVYLGGGALGDGWAYNPVTKMRVYVASIVDLTIQKPGEPVVFPEGVEVPDAPDPNAIYPSGEKDWCYVGADCPEAQKDGFHTWRECGAAWDTRPGVPYPNDPETCPVLGYDGPQVELTALTRKNNGDVCVGIKGDNACHDPSPTGGSVMGYVSSIQMSPNMVMLQQACITAPGIGGCAGDVCIFPAGELEKWCKADGEYSSPIDLGYIFTVGIAGTTPLIGKFNKGSQDSCANTNAGDMSCGITASKTSTTAAKFPVKLGTMGFLLKTEAEGAWRHCHNFEHYHATNEPGAFKYGLLKAAKKRGGSWSVSASVSVEGKAPESMKVSWMAFAQGVYETASDTIFQVGIAPIVADGEEKTIPLHQEMGTAPIVIIQPIGSATVRQREASTTDLYFIADGNGETVMVQWIAFEPTDNGYFGSVPFVAGVLDGESGEEKTWPDGEFTQPPLIYSSIATDRSDGEVSVRIVNNTPESTIFVQEGSQTAEKVAYMAYNGKGQGGAVINAETVAVQTYNWTVGEYSADCSREGQTTRTVSCAGSNGKTYDAAFCTAFAGTAEPDSSNACTGPETMLKSGDKCLHYSVHQGFLEMADCSGVSTQRFHLTSDGLLQSSKDGKCVAAVDGAVKVETCSAGLDTQSWYFDEGKIVSAAGDSSCLEVDPSSMVNVLLGECGSLDTQTFETAEPVLHAKKYGSFQITGPNCLEVGEDGKLKRGFCSHLMKNAELNPAQTWMLTMNDELKSEATDECVETSGLLNGEYSDSWTPGASFTLKLGSDGLVTSSNCDGPLDGSYDDKWTPGHVHRICSEKRSDTEYAVSMTGGVSGTYVVGNTYLDYCNKYPDLKDAYCGGKDCTAGKEGECKSHWENHGIHEAREGPPATCYLEYCNNHWDLKAHFCNGANCNMAQFGACIHHWENHGVNEDRWKPTTCLDAEGALTMNFAGAVVKAYVNGDKIEWANKNSYTKKAGSENDSKPTMDFNDGTLTWPLFTGTLTGNVVGNKIYWPNDAVYTRKGENLFMAPCSGSTAQKWTIDDVDSIVSQLDSHTCITITSESSSGWAGSNCHAGGSEHQRVTVANQPSWVTEA